MAIKGVSKNLNKRFDKILDRFLTKDQQITQRPFIEKWIERFAAMGREANAEYDEVFGDKNKNEDGRLK